MLNFNRSGMLERKHYKGNQRKKRKKTLPPTFLGTYIDDPLREEFQVFLASYDADKYFSLHAKLREHSRAVFSAPEERDTAAKLLLDEIFLGLNKEKFSISQATISELKSATKSEEVSKALTSLRLELENFLDFHWTKFHKKKLRQKSLPSTSKKIAKFFSPDKNKNNGKKPITTSANNVSRIPDSPRVNKDKSGTLRKDMFSSSPPKNLPEKSQPFQTIFVDGELFERFLQYLTRGGAPLRLPVYVHIRHFLSSNTGRLSAEEVRAEAKKIADMIGLGTETRNDVKDKLSEEILDKLTQDLNSDKIPQVIFDDVFRELGNILAESFATFSKEN